MLQRLNQLIIRISKSGWLVVLTTVIAFGSLAILMQIGNAFPAHASGAQPFDLQNALTPDQVYPQIAGYTERARQLYYLFTTIDYVFPFAAGLFMAAAGAFALRHGLPQIYAGMVSRRLLPLFLIGSAFDWCENVAALAAILSHPDGAGAIATALVAAKRAKLFFVVLTQALTVVLLLIAGIRWISRKAAVRN
jgi:hypothetical protein